MISSQEALQIILNNTQDFGLEEISFLEATGRVLKEDICGKCAINIKKHVKLFRSNDRSRLA